MVLPQSLHKQPPESQELLQEVGPRETRRKNVSTALAPSYGACA